MKINVFLVLSLENEVDSLNCLSLTAVVLGSTTATAGGITVAFEFACAPAIENGLGAADSNLYRDGIDRTVFGTGTAFHTGIAILDSHFSFICSKDRMRADLQTPAASDTYICIQC